MPNGSNSFNPNNSGNNSGPNPNAEDWQNIDAANGSPNLENMNLDQLLELDIDNLSYEELKVMHRRLTEEIQVIDADIARLRQNLGLPPIESQPTDPSESQPIPTNPDQPPTDPTQPDRPVANPTQSDQPTGNPTNPDQPIADPTQSDQPIVNPVPPVLNPKQPAPNPGQPTNNPDNQPNPAGNPANQPGPTGNPNNQPGPANNPDNRPDSPTNNPNKVSSADVKEMDKKGRKKPTFRQYAKKVFYQGAAIALTAFTLFTAGSKLFNRNKRDNKNTNTPTQTEQQIETEPKIGQSAETIIEANNEDDAVVDGEFAGELPNGVTYDYSHYADRDEKESYNAFDYDMSEYFNDVDGTKESFMNVASSTPEALAAYSYSIFNAGEKASLGINGMTANQIDDYISNDTDGGAMQQRLLAALQNVLDEDGTELYFYYENGKEKTYYIYFVDDNENGKMDPGEMHLAYDIKDRKNALQVTILRGGKAALDLNISCGYQPNFEQAPEGVPYVPSDERTEETRGSYVKVSYDAESKIKEGDQPSVGEGKDIKIPKEDSTGDESTGYEKTGDEGTETDESKDPENLKRIDEEEDKKGTEDHGSEGLNKDATPKEEVDSQEPTEKPDSDSYEGSKAEVEEHEESDDAEDVHEDVSPDNDYEEDRGGSNDNEYSPNEDDDSGQDEADEHESSDEESAPDTADEAEDELEDLDIE